MDDPPAPRGFQRTWNRIAPAHVDVHKLAKSKGSMLTRTFPSENSDYSTRPTIGSRRRKDALRPRARTFLGPLQPAVCILAIFSILFSSCFARFCHTPFHRPALSHSIPSAPCFVLSKADPENDTQLAKTGSCFACKTYHSVRKAHVSPFLIPLPGIANPHRLPVALTESFASNRFIPHIQSRAPPV